MSVPTTRPQYVFIDVKRTSATPCVALSGPQEALRRISILSTGVYRATTSLVGKAQEIRLTTTPNADNYSLLKVALPEEVLKLGFKPASSVSDDFLILSREVNI